MNLKAQSNSKSGHKNITFDHSRSDYHISVYRNGKFFVMRANTLEEAIVIRDKALEFYEEHSRLPKRSDLGIEKRKKRRLKERVKKVRSVYTCEMCKRKLSYINDQLVKPFKDRGNICGHCKPKTRSDLSLDNRARKLGRLNEKYISFSINRGRAYYQVSLEKYGRSISRSFRNFEDAINYRNQILDFYKEQERLPNDLELETVFNAKIYNRKTSNEPTDSINSATGLKNIAYHEKTDRYYISISRNRAKSTISLKTLEDAKLARQIILNAYEESGVMLKSGEVRAKMKELKENEILRATETIN